MNFYRKTTMKTYKNLLVLLINWGLIQVALAVSCGDIITTNLTLESDLHCTDHFTALDVRNSNITIDLNGYTLSGTNTHEGVFIIDQNNVVIKNGQIKGFDIGINTAEANQTHIQDILFYSMTAGVILSSSNNAMVNNNQFIFIEGISVSIFNAVSGLSASNNTIKANEFYKSGTGIQICGKKPMPMT